MTRQTKTPRQRAEDTLGVAQRRVDRLRKDKATAQAALNRTQADLEQAEARLAYAQQDPALATTTAAPSTTLTTPGGTTA